LAASKTSTALLAWAIYAIDTTAIPAITVTVTTIFMNANPITIIQFAGACTEACTSITIGAINLFILAFIV